MKFLIGLAASLTILSASLKAQDPQKILEGARLAATLTEIQEGLQGTLSKSGRKTPITLFLRGKNIQFQFTEKGQPLRIFHMRLSDDKFDLFEIINGKTVNFDRNKLVEPIAGTDLTYEDLSLRFFYWPNPKLEGIEKVAGQDCYKLRLDKPNGAAGRYEAVYVWVHTKFGAFMRIRGHDAKGVLVKEFQVEDVMQVADGVWTLRQMQVATHDSKSGRRASITDVTLNKPSKGTLKGLR
ncbi:outer membrane lipoprotein-sorting protein [Luteolibacter algae]|uniref:Outer membrane lipoprotein-sorting protein n=1 Tax=Luteolibacter algae TaxID=454151 RepID=A0ABW5D8V1_9BACT